MSPDDYVAAVLKRYDLQDGPESPAARTAGVLAELVKPWSGHCLIGTMPTGSWAKGTRIRGSTDLDLLVLLGPRTRGTPEKIHHSLFAFLKRNGHSPRQRNVAISMQFRGLLVDLVPARQEWGSGSKAAIFETERGRPTVTDLDAHVRLIRDSGRVADIRALKVWRDLRGLRFPSFYLELVVLDALKRRPRNQPADNLLVTLEYLRDNFAGTSFRDPVNVENKVSTELTEHEQMAIAAAAGETLQVGDWERIIR
ncbi:MAG: hypothetical protein R6X12_00755 [bacterium]